MIASHYAEPVGRHLRSLATLREAPSADAAAVDEIARGDPFLMLDESLGWAWGYAGGSRRVGYVPADSLGP